MTDPRVEAIVRIAREIPDPLLGYELEASARALVASRPVAVVNPGVKSWEQHVEEMVAVLKSLDQELKDALEEYETAEEFSKFFEEGIVEEDELKKILDRTRELGKVASTAGVKDFFKNMLRKLKKESDEAESSGVEPSYVLDESTIDDFLAGKAEWADASHYVQEEFQENKDFFTGAQDVLSEMEKARHRPTRDALQRIQKRVQQLVRAGQRMLQGIRKHLLEPAPQIQIEEDEEPEAPAGKKTVFNLEGTVGHYIDVLRENLDDPDRLVKLLRELFSEVQPAIETERASLAARDEARRRVLPVLVRFAKERPHVRPMLLPILRQAAGR